MEKVKAGVLALGAMGLAFDLDLPNQGGDGLDGIWHGEEPHQGRSRRGQARMNALADSPDLGFAAKAGESLHSKIGHDVIELANQPLVGPENNGADGVWGSFCFSSGWQWRGIDFSETRSETELDGAIVISQSAHGILVLTDARGGQRFHGADDGLKVPGAADLAAEP
jgi:hypothetical protein